VLIIEYGSYKLGGDLIGAEGSDRIFKD